MELSHEIDSDINDIELEGIVQRILRGANNKLK
jgi:hypothetical protein